MKFPKVCSVRVAGPAAIEIEWSTGKRMRVDLAPVVRRYSALAPLRQRAVFQRATVGEWGHSVTWGEKLEMGADTLYRLAREQRGEIVPAATFAAWRRRHGLSTEAAASALGLSRRVVEAYESGKKIIPKIVGLALKGYDAPRAA